MTVAFKLFLSFSCVYVYLVGLRLIRVVNRAGPLLSYKSIVFTTVTLVLAISARVVDIYEAVIQFILG